MELMGIQVPNFVILLLVVFFILASLVGAIYWRYLSVKKEKKRRNQKFQKIRRKTAALPPNSKSPPSHTMGAINREATEHRPVVLVVDDSKVALLNAKKILEDQSYRVVTASNGREAWAYMQDTVPDVVVSDVDMPIMTGFDLLKMMREDYKLSETPFILMTKNIEIHIQYSNVAGFDSLLQKPFKPEDLVEQVRFLLED